jgi:hypothetical protein
MMSLQFLSLIIMAVIITKYSGETNYGKEGNVFIHTLLEQSTMFILTISFSL